MTMIGIGILSFCAGAALVLCAAHREMRNLRLIINRMLAYCDDEARKVLKHR
jgi:hypothetical protein